MIWLYFQEDSYIEVMKILQNYQDMLTHGISEIKIQNGHHKIGFKDNNSLNSLFQNFNDLRTSIFINFISVINFENNMKKYVINCDQIENFEVH